MKKSSDRRSFAGLLGLLALAACTPDAAAPPTASAAAARVRSFHYAGSAGSSEVTLEQSDDGQQSLRGRTDLGLPEAGAQHTLAEEAVTLDARGRLERARIVVSRSGESEVVYTLDAARGAVRVEHAGSAPIDWQVPLDAPWFYSPGNSPDSAPSVLMATPLGAWVALRAAGTATILRVVEPERLQSYLVTVDQVAVPTELGTTLALGYDGVDADERFIKQLRLFHGSVTLTRVAAAELGA